MTQEFSLLLANGLPLTFSGVSLARQEDVHDGRGYRLELYRITDTDGLEQGKERLVGGITYLTIFRHEAELSRVYVANSQRKLAQLLLDYDPLSFFIGYPAGAQFEARQAKLRQSLTNRYAKLCGEFIAAHLPEAQDRL